MHYEYIVPAPGKGQLSSSAAHPASWHSTATDRQTDTSFRGTRQMCPWGQATRRSLVSTASLELSTLRNRPHGSSTRSLEFVSTSVLKSLFCTVSRAGLKVYTQRLFSSSCMVQSVFLQAASNISSWLGTTDDSHTNLHLLCISPLITALNHTAQH